MADVSYLLLFVTEVAVLVTDSPSDDSSTKLTWKRQAVPRSVKWSRYVLDHEMPLRYPPTSPPSTKCAKSSNVDSVRHGLLTTSCRRSEDGNVILRFIGFFDFISYMIHLVTPRCLEKSYLC